MKNFKIIIEYDGSRYNGWQKQGNTKNTIEYKFLEILKKMTGKNVEIFASGRTDSGVHAKGQVANFRIDTEMSAEDILSYINTYLPEDIRVLSCTEENERFHSRLNAIKKTYMYRIHQGKPPVFERKYVYSINERLDISAMKEASKHFIGTYDFVGFASSGYSVETTVRTIYELNTEKNDNIITIDVKGNGFLYNMVRIITGTLVYVGGGKIAPDDIPHIINYKDRTKAGITAPAKGLCLKEVFY